MTPPGRDDRSQRSRDRSDMPYRQTPPAIPPLTGVLLITADHNLPPPRGWVFRARWSGSPLYLAHAPDRGYLQAGARVGDCIIAHHESVASGRPVAGFSLELAEDRNNVLAVVCVAASGDETTWRAIMGTPAQCLLAAIRRG